MSETPFDVIVAGGGPAGLTAACLIAARGRTVGLIAGSAQGGQDPRTVALMQPAINLLTRLGVWPDDLAGNAAPLRKLRLVDDMQNGFTAPDVTFDSHELGTEPFGWNIPLSRLIAALTAAAERRKVTFFPLDAVDFEPAPERAKVRLSDQSVISAPLVLAADGRSSRMRHAAGVTVEEWSYVQSAIATSFAHSGPHRDTSTEYHRPGGPFTTVPLPGRRSSLVWMERPERAEELLALGDDALASEIQLATHGELGRIGEIGPRRLFPMRGLRARQLGSPRLMLVGEAAHVIPPLGAQGLNMSFRDVVEAADIIDKFEDPGSEKVVAAYAEARKGDIQSRQAVIDAMNRSLLADIFWLNSMRAGAIAGLEAFSPLRRFVMWRGLQPPGPLPSAMRLRA